jgi:hypothetical protein
VLALEESKEIRTFADPVAAPDLLERMNPKLIKQRKIRKAARLPLGQVSQMHRYFLSLPLFSVTFLKCSSSSNSHFSF